MKHEGHVVSAGAQMASMVAIGESLRSRHGILRHDLMRWCGGHPSVIHDVYCITDVFGIHTYTQGLIPAALMILGSSLPDRDLKPMGPVTLFHRGWTHSDWLLIGLLAVALLPPCHVLIWLWCGILSHDLIDELSTAGRVHFYPLTKHRVTTFPDGTRCVVKPRWRGLYTVGAPSETVLLMVQLLATGGIIGWLGLTL